MQWKHVCAFAFFASSVFACTEPSKPAASEPQQTLLNVSFDATRELYDEINAAFVADVKAKQGITVAVKQSHGGSGKQARAVLDGLQADVVTLAIPYDVDQLVKAGLVQQSWDQKKEQAHPFASTIVFVVRAGNPKGIKDWDDLVKPGVVVITPNPKTSGAARLAYLAAWDHGGREYVEKLYARVPVLDTGARAATTTFAERQMGDVLLSWESDARLLQSKNTGRDTRATFEIVTPSVSIEAPLPVAVVDQTVDKRGTRALAESYVAFLSSAQAQQIAEKHHYRVKLNDAAKQPQKEQPFAAVKLRKVTEIAGSWEAAQKQHFDDYGVFDALPVASAVAGIR